MRSYRGFKVGVERTREGDWLALVWPEDSRDDGLGERFSDPGEAWDWVYEQVKRLERAAWLRAQGQMSLPEVDGG